MYVSWYSFHFTVHCKNADSCLCSFNALPSLVSTEQKIYFQICKTNTVSIVFNSRMNTVQSTGTGGGHVNKKAQGQEVRQTSILRIALHSTLPLTTSYSMCTAKINYLLQGMSKQIYFCFNTIYVWQMVSVISHKMGFIGIFCFFFFRRAVVFFGMLFCHFDS